MQFKREQIGFTRSLSRLAPVIWTEHGRFYRGPMRALLAARYREAARFAAGIICVSEEVADDISRYSGGTPIHVIENSVDTVALRVPSPTERQSARAGLGIAANTPVLLWIGRVHRDKRPDFAVSIARHWPGVTLLVGDGPMHKEVEVLARDVPNLKMLGHLAEPAIAYQAADAFAFTSTGAGEGFPTAVVEASAFGVPSVTETSSGGARLVREAGGTVLADGTPAADWAAALSAIADSTAARTSARAWAERHDIRSWAQAHAGVIEKLIKNRT
jgi:glycosyltransferase involved in cell wall biosynthesis